MDKKALEEPPNSKMLKELAIYLEGLCKGQGNLHPLGTIHLENLWKAIRYLQDKQL